MKIKIFIDSSVIISAMISSEGASRQVLTLCEAETLDGVISDKVIEEVGRVIMIKFPKMKGDFEALLRIVKFKIIKKISGDLLLRAKKWISDENDVPILAAAKFAKVDVLLTLDIRHFIRDPDVSKKSKLKIMTPGEFMRGFCLLGAT